MINFFESVLGFFQMLGNALINALNGIFSLIMLIPKAFVMVTTCLDYIPPQITVFAVAGLSVTIVFLILGR